MRAVTFLIASLVMLTCHIAAERGFGRSRRSILNFGEMIKTATGRPGLDYNGYGCFCGIGGKGRPVDNVDRCCQAHDNCYGRCKRVCGQFNLYLQNYKFNKRNLACDPRNNACAKGLCECDRRAAYCFKRHRYNNRYKNYAKWLFCH